MIEKCILRSLQVMTPLSVERVRAKRSGISSDDAAVFCGVIGHDFIIF